MFTFNAFVKQQFQNPEYKKEYEALASELSTTPPEKTSHAIFHGIRSVMPLSEYKLLTILLMEHLSNTMLRLCVRDMPHSVRDERILALW